MKFLAIVGSIRKEAWSKKVALALSDFAPEGVEIEVLVPSDLPLFNQDLESNFPESATNFKHEIASSDGVIFVTPEHNHSTTAVLKNAIEWASRPYPDGAWRGKPAGIISSSPGMTGGVRAQVALRVMSPEMGVFIMDSPEVIISRVFEKFDEEGKLVDEKTREKLTEFLKAFSEWTSKFSG